MQYAKNYYPYYEAIWITVLVESILFLSFSVFLIYKSCKIQNNRFFLLICILIIIEAFSGEEIFRKFSEDWKIVKYFPEPINCLKLEPVIKGFSTLDRNGKVTAWMISLFFFAYINLELVFSLKYWTLSLKI